MTRTDADKPLRRARYRHAAIRTLRWLAFGALVSFATGWGCILWRVHVAFNWTPASGQVVPMTAWPFEIGEKWDPPTTCEETVGLGYCKVQASGTRLPNGPEGWVDLQEAIREQTARMDAAMKDLQQRRRVDSSASMEIETVKTLEAHSGQLRRILDNRDRAVRFMVFQRHSGWPIRCMESRYVSRTSPNGAATTYLVGEEFSEVGSARASWQQIFDRGLLWPAAWAPPSGTTFTLPLRPVWPRFALNTLIWAAIGCTASIAIAAMRRRNRRLAGECIQCRYQIAGLAICPECGRPVDASATDAIKVQAD